MKKMIKEIIKIYKKHGFIFENRKKHIAAIYKYTKKMVIIGRIPSDYRAYKNICKMLDNAMAA